MNPTLVDSTSIKKIVDKTLSMIEESKNEIYGIVEQARDEVERIKSELKQISGTIQNVIQEADYLESMDKAARQKLVQVSKDFKNFTEKDIKEAYEKASDIRLKYSVKQLEEKSLREQRTRMEMMLKKAQQVLESAEKLINQVGVAMQYLSGGITDLSGGNSEESLYWGIKVLEAQEEERKRISRDIHDGPAQSIANIVLKAEICKALMHRDPEKGLAELDVLKETVRHTLKDIRKIIYDLRPMSLDDLGLVPTLRRYLSEYTEDSGILTEVQIGTVVEDVEKIIQLAVFRLVQEMTTNIRKHAKATVVKVELNFGTKYLQLLIEDNGAGFNVEETIARIKRDGNSFGLMGQMERVRQLHGDIEIESEIGSGTRTEVRLPINREVMRDEFQSH